MATLSPITFKSSSLNGEVMQFVASVSVTSQGEFSLSIPDELEASVKGVIAREYKSMSGTAARIDRPRAKLRVYGTKLEDCVRLIKNAMEDFLHCEVERQLVILYGTKISVAYAKAPDGRLGTDCLRVAGGVWCGTLNATHHSAYYSVGLAAVVRLKTTYSRQSGVKVTYDHPDRPNFADELWLDKLNSFCGLNVKECDMVEMPYSEEAAKFFYEIMIAMCQLADRVHSFFSDTPRLLGAIQNQTRLITMMKDS